MEIGAGNFYWAAAGGALVCFLIAAIAPAAAEAEVRLHRWLPRPGPRAFAALMALVLFLFRWPVIFDPKNVGIDEGLWIAGALTLFEDPVFWRGLDGDTAGPLVFYALMPLEPLGMLDFVGLKIAATLLLWGALWFSYAGFRAVWGDALARLGVLPAACFFGLETRLEFVSYSTEHVTLLLLAIGFGGLLRAIARPESFSPWAWPWLGAGAALGAVPFAKLQGVASAGFLVLVALAWAASRRAWSVRRRLHALAAFAAAVCLVPLAFALTLAAGLRWEDFWISYLEINLARSARVFAADATKGFLAWEFVRHSRMFQVLLFGAPLIAVVAAGWGTRVRLLWQWPVFVLVGLWGLSIATALAPAYSFHHLHFLVLPLSLLGAGVVAARWRETSPAPGAPPWRQRGLLVVFLAVLVAPQLGLFLRREHAHPANILPPSRREIGAMAREILRYARPEDRLTVWGNQHVLHAQTRLSQGTREGNPRIPVVGPRFRDYFRRRYLADLERSRSRFFVDQASARPEDAARRARWGHEADPEVRDYVARHYDYLGEFEGMRLYLRKAPGE